MTCYFCEHEAEKKGIGHRAKKLVDCPECGKYTITYMALDYYFLLKDNKFLTKEDKKKLSDYVKKNYTPEKDKPVPINMKIIESVTGKRSESVRYR